MYKSLSGFGPFKGQIERRAGGVMIALENGQVTTYSLESLQERGVLFVKPGDKVYAGQVVGENARQQDMIVNPCKAKKLDNMRSATKELDVKLDAPRLMSLEEALEYINSDELVEVTRLLFAFARRSLTIVIVSVSKNSKAWVRSEYANIKRAIFVIENRYAGDSSHGLIEPKGRR